MNKVKMIGGFNTGRGIMENTRIVLLLLIVAWIVVFGSEEFEYKYKQGHSYVTNRSSLSKLI